MFYTFSAGERYLRNIVSPTDFGYDQDDYSRQLEMVRDPSTIINLADSGAHCGVLYDAATPSYMLSYYVRDRQRGERLPLEWVIKALTRDTARCVDLHDRGTLEVGMKADINIIDFDKIKRNKPEVLFDLPAGGRRVYQSVDGYRATIVSGIPIYEDGEHTGALPGRLIRGGQPGPSASIH